MSKLTRRKNLKSKIVTEPSKIPEKATKTVHQTDISEYFDKEKNGSSEHLVLPEVSLPSPDDAALPCSTTLGSESCKNLKNVKGLDAESIKEPIVPVEKSQKISDMTNKVLKEVSKKKKIKKPVQPQLRNSQVTDFFPVRRSNRKPLPFVKKEKQKTIEEAILSGKEDGFEIKEFPEKGRGVITTKAIDRGEFVMEYHGELIDYEEAVRRETVYAMKENTGCYMYYFKCNNKRYCIDATKESGRLGRLINHSKKCGNLKTQPMLVGSSPRLALFANRDIGPGEELLYDYGDRSKQALESHPWLAL